MRARPARFWLVAFSLISAASAQSLATAYQAATTARIGPVAVVEDIAFRLDGLEVHLDDGFLGWGSPVAGQPTALVFSGHGSLALSPPNRIEAGQAKLFTGKETIKFSLRAAVFRFADAARLKQALGDQAHFFYPARHGAERLEQVLAGRLAATAKAGRATPARVLDGLSARAAAPAWAGELLLAEIQRGDGKWVHVDVDPLERQPLRVYTVAQLNVPLAILPWYKGKTRERFHDTWTQLAPSDVARAPPPWTITDYELAITLGRKPVFQSLQTLTLKAASPQRGILLRLDGKYRVTAATTGGNPLEFLQARDPRPMFGDDYSGDWLYLLWPRPVVRGESVQFTLTVVNKHAGREYSTGLREWVWPDQAWYPVIPFGGATRRAHFRASVTELGKGGRQQVLMARWGADPGRPLPMPNFGLLSVNPATAKPGGKVKGLAWAGLPADNADEKKLRSVLADAVLFYGQAFGDLPLRRLQLVLARPYFPYSRVSGRDLGKAASRLGASEAGVAGSPIHGPQHQVGPVEIGPPGETPLERAQAPPSLAGHIPGEKNNLPWAQPEPAPMSGLLQRDAPSWPGLAVVSASWADYGLQGYPSMIYIPYGELWPTPLQLFDFAPEHVVARQWWGDWVGWSSRQDQWLGEALASGAAELFADHEFGDQAAAALRATWLKELTSKDSFWHIPNAMGPLALGPRLASSLDPAAYDVGAEDKGGYIVEMLRSMMGAARFRAALHEFTAQFGGRDASVEDFERTMTAHMSPAMDLSGDGTLSWFFGEYVRRRAIDALQVNWVVQRGRGRGVRIEITIDNPDGWRGLLPLYLFRTKTKTQRALLPVTAATVRVLVAVPFTPIRIAADPWHEMLVKLKPVGLK